MSIEDLLRLARDVAGRADARARRLRTSYAARRAVSVLELLYPLMQGYDSVAMRADVELGGTDQKFNLLMGRDCGAGHGQRSRSVLTMPMLCGDRRRAQDVEVLGNQIGMTEAPEEMYGKTMSIPDTAMEGWYRLLLGEELPAELGPRATPSTRSRGGWWRAFHGEEAAQAAAERFPRVFVEGERARGRRGGRRPRGTASTCRR